MDSKAQRKTLIQDYEPWMQQAAIDWIKEGWSLYTFPAKHDISKRAWSKMLRHEPELQLVRELYLSKVSYYSKTRNNNMELNNAG